MHPFAEKPKSGTQNRFVETLTGTQARRFQQIARNVFTNKLVVRHVGVECADHVVAILIGIGRIVVEFMTA